jgi:NADH-ubiquinone oxidoreductase chain 2
MIILSILTLLVAMSLPSIKNQITPVLFSRIALLSLTYSAILAFNMVYIQSIGSGVGLFAGLFQITIISQLTDIFIFLIASSILIISQFYTYKFNYDTISLSTNKKTNNDQILLKNKDEISEYSLIILFSVAGGSLLISSADLVSMYLSIELQSFAVYILATIYKNSLSSTSAGLKYFLLGGLSSCLILLGSGIIYTYTGLSNLESIYSLVSVSDSININQGFTLGLILILVGFLFKVSAAPFHNWAPDVYDNVPTIVTTWLSIMPKISIFIFLLEIQSLPWIDYNILNVEFYNKNLLLISSLLSLIIGSIVGLAQVRIKRLLTYSTISHVGFLLLALSINTEQSVEAFLFYIVQYTITNLNLFLILLSFGYILYMKPKNNFLYANNYKLNDKNDIENITDLKGQFNSNPVLGLTFAISLFSMAGIPPLIGFFGKQQVLYSATYNGYYFLSLVAIIVSVISASYYLKIIKEIHFSNINVNILNTNNKNEDLLIQNSPSYLISVLTLINLLFILNPSLILNGIHLIALSLFYT